MHALGSHVDAKGQVGAGAGGRALGVAAGAGEAGAEGDDDGVEEAVTGASGREVGPPPAEGSGVAISVGGGGDAWHALATSTSAATMESTRDILGASVLGSSGTGRGRLRSMSAAKQARAVIERYVELHQTGDAAGLAEIIADDFRYRSGAVIGVAGVAAQMRALHAGFTELVCTLEQCVAEDEWAAFRFTIAGTHTGVFAGRAPSGRRITWSGADFVKLRDGKLVELWSVADSLPLMEGIGAVVRVGS